MAALGWMALLFWLSASDDAQGGGWLTALFPHADKVIHAAAYGVLGSLLYVASRSFWVAVVIASLYGVTDELHQAFVPGRSADVLDWVADTLGALLAVGLLRQGVRFLTKRRT